MNACSLALSTIFVKAGIKPHFIYLTVGQFGIPKNSSQNPEEMAELRYHETAKAAAVLGATFNVLGFTDTRLAFIDKEIIIEAVISLIRLLNPDVLFSFNDENQRHINHPDHRVTAQVAEYVADMLNVKYAFPQYPAPAERPTFYRRTFHTENTEEKIHSVPLSDEEMQKHNQYLGEVHGSQFHDKADLKWIQIFEDLARDRDGSFTERYIKTR